MRRVCAGDPLGARRMANIQIPFREWRLKPRPGGDGDGSVSGASSLRGLMAECSRGITGPLLILFLYLFLVFGLQ